ncbi:MAG TPA: TorF family putative porin [bacterium]|nr:TorF family putative porin [bacterium]
MKRRTIAVGVIICMLGIGGAGRAQEDESVNVSLSAAYATRYLWRGITLNHDPVCQPSVTFAKSGFTLNFWGSVDTTDWGKKGGYGDRTGQLTEADYTGEYSRDLAEKVNVAVGFVTYTYPHTELDSTTEIYFLLGFDLPLAPTFSYYVDEDAVGGAAYYGLDLSHGFTLWESGERSVELDLGGHLAYANNKFITPYFGIEFTQGGAWHDWSAGVALPCAIGHGITVTPSYLYTSLWDEAIRREASEYGDEIRPDNNVLTLEVAWDLTL